MLDQLHYKRRLRRTRQGLRWSLSVLTNWKHNSGPGFVGVTPNWSQLRQRRSNGLHTMGGGCESRGAVLVTLWDERSSTVNWNVLVLVNQMSSLLLSSSSNEFSIPRIIRSLSISQCTVDVSLRCIGCAHYSPPIISYITGQRPREKVRESGNFTFCLLKKRLKLWSLMKRTV